MNVGRPAKLVVAFVLAATVGCEIAAILVYRNPTDGQTPILWG